MSKLKVLDLFSGIGGFSLGLERTNGFKTVAFCEIEPYCRAVLRKRWPGLPIHQDIRTLTKGHLQWVYRIGAIDVICGGFPCQDISSAGGKAGLSGLRSGLWREYARIIGELRPRYVIVENVADLLSRGLGDVLGDLASLGYDAEWHCISAAHVGAPHIRDRLWIIAYPNGQGKHDGAGDAEVAGISARLADALSERQSQPLGTSEEVRGRGPGKPAGLDGGERHTWLAEPDVGRVADGIPNRMDRLRGLGNSLVPQIPEVIGKAILEGVRSTQ